MARSAAHRARAPAAGPGGCAETRPLRPRGPWLQRTLTSQASPRPSVLSGPGPLLGGRCSSITPNPGHWVRVTAKPARAWRSSRSGCRGGGRMAPAACSSPPGKWPGVRLEAGGRGSRGHTYRPGGGGRRDRDGGNEEGPGPSELQPDPRWGNGGDDGREPATRGGSGRGGRREAGAWGLRKESRAGPQPFREHPAGKGFS